MLVVLKTLTKLNGADAGLQRKGAHRVKCFILP